MNKYNPGQNGNNNRFKESDNLGLRFEYELKSLFSFGGGEFIFFLLKYSKLIKILILIRYIKHIFYLITCCLYTNRKKQVQQCSLSNTKIQLPFNCPVSNLNSYDIDNKSKIPIQMTCKKIHKPKNLEKKFLIPPISLSWVESNFLTC